MESTLDNIIKNNLGNDSLRQFNRIFYGREDNCELLLRNETENQFEVGAYYFHAAQEETRKRRLVKLGLIQHSIVLPTGDPISNQREAIVKKIQKIIEFAASEDVNIVCLQETWSMPFFLCTKQKEPWREFAESTESGPSIMFLRELAKRLNIVIVSPILEKDTSGKWWNTAVVVDETGDILGKHRKNHLPSVGSFSETSFYEPGDTGHPVFDTKYGKIAVNICYGRHQALNWLMFGVNGAEIVFNPSATISEFGESFWGIEARNAAVANSYFTCSINRVGTETFAVPDENGDEIKTVSRTYYGSSYITAPDGSRTPGLSRLKDGLLIAVIDLNLCRQMKDKWGFNMTQRLDLYAKELNNIVNNI